MAVDDNVEKLEGTAVFDAVLVADAELVEDRVAILDEDGRELVVG